MNCETKHFINNYCGIATIASITPGITTAVVVCSDGYYGCVGGWDWISGLFIIGVISLLLFAVGLCLLIFKRKLATALVLSSVLLTCSYAMGLYVMEKATLIFYGERRYEEQVPESNETFLNKSENLQENLTNLTIIKNYAENYEPKPEKNTVIPSTPNPDDRVLGAVNTLANSESRAHEKYIVLIFLRLHRYHIEHFKQTYDLGGNPLAKEFYRLTFDNYKLRGEPNLSYLAGYWVETNPELLKYSLIENEMKRIKKAEERIRKGQEKSSLTNRKN
jgi:hypothetical protein